MNIMLFSKTIARSGVDKHVKQSIIEMIFNPNDEKMLIVFKELLLQIMPGENSPLGFTESDHASSEKILGSSKLYCTLNNYCFSYRIGHYLLSRNRYL